MSMSYKLYRPANTKEKVIKTLKGILLILFLHIKTKWQALQVNVAFGRQGEQAERNLIILNCLF